MGWGGGVGSGWALQAPCYLTLPVVRAILKVVQKPLLLIKQPSNCDLEVLQGTNAHQHTARTGDGSSLTWLPS